MATIIKLKRSTTASSIPTTSDLVDGEVAVNVLDKKLYVRNGVSVVEVANNLSLLNVNSNIVPDTDVTYDIGTLASSFRDILVGRDIKTKCNIFTNADGLSSAKTQFTFKINTIKQAFDEVYTSTLGLSTKAVSSSVGTFDDNNPAFLF